MTRITSQSSTKFENHPTHTYVRAACPPWSHAPFTDKYFQCLAMLVTKICVLISNHLHLTETELNLA